MAIDYEKIALEYAKSISSKSLAFDIVRHCIDHNGYSYYYITFTNRPRYTGHPHVVKIDESGEIYIVNDLKEQYWAVNHAK